MAAALGGVTSISCWQLRRTFGTVREARPRINSMTRTKAMLFGKSRRNSAARCMALGGAMSLIDTVLAKNIYVVVRMDIICKEGVLLGAMSI